ncbi:HAD hydrolase family protein [Candidatus Bathyarchaeota archaeon]|nr:HAD hydrolase family protein [Candidatus Bathyarchaeota archaeon]
MAIYITDCEGPVSKNDNAFEFTSWLIPNGDKLFTIISRYDDVLADIIKRPGYKAGDTLKLVIPFLKAYGATNSLMRRFSAETLLLMPGSAEALSYIKSIMPTFIVSTSYEPYIDALCKAIDFPKENVYCTRVNIDWFEMPDEEKEILKEIKEEIINMPMIEVPANARVFEDLPQETQKVIKRLDEIFWSRIISMKIGRALKEVNPVGGYEKARAVEEIVSRLYGKLHSVIYIGDSITDVESFRLVRGGGGLTISFNGNQYAVREAEIAVLSHDAIILAVLAEQFKRYGKEHVLSLADDWDISSLEGYSSPSLLERLKRLYPDRAPWVERITPENMDRLIHESTAFRKTVRGEAIGSLG